MIYLPVIIPSRMAKLKTFGYGNYSSLYSLSDCFPFSLQELCSLYIVGHLDQYSLEYLTLLPTTMRHQLLIRLPAVDLQLLENTFFLKDIDTELYWKRIFCHFQESLPSHCVCLSSNYNSANLKPCSFKEDFLNKAVDSVLQYHPDTCRHICHCLPLTSFISIRYVSRSMELHPYNRYNDYVKRVFEHAGLCLVCSQHKIVFPLRLQATKHLSSCVNNYKESVLAAIDILTNCFDHFPKYLTVYKPPFKSQDVFQLQIHPLIKYFLASIKILRCAGEFKNMKRTFHTVSKPLSCLKSLHIGHLCTTYDTSCCALQLEKCLPFFTPTHECPAYDGLEELFVQDLQDHSGALLSRLSSMLLNQKHMRRIELTGQLNSNQNFEIFLSTLFTLTEQPQFERFDIQLYNYNDNLSIEEFLKVLVSTLSTSCTHHFLLPLNNIKMVVSCTSSSKVEKLSMEFNKVLPKDAPQHINTVSFKETSLQEVYE